MAHHAKYNSASLGHMLGHYNRDKGSYSRDNIDPERAHLNYTLITEHRGEETDREFIDARVNNLVHRETVATIKMVDVCLTVPADYKGNIERFFESSFNFMADRYGRENVIGGYVHMDEKDARPHMHFAFVPAYHDREQDVDRLNAKKVVCRTDLRSFHKDLEKHLERDKIHARVINGATRDLREQLQHEKAKGEFYEREFKLDKEQQERLNKYLEQQKEVNHIYNREMLKEEQEHQHERDHKNNRDK